MRLRLVTTSAQSTANAARAAALRLTPAMTPALASAAAVARRRCLLETVTAAAGGRRLATASYLNGSRAGSTVNGSSSASVNGDVNGRTEWQEQHRQRQPQRVQRPIYVSATKQHTGKTTASLALVSGLSRRFEKVGFVKPVGQKCLPVVHPAGEDEEGTVRMVDKDAVLVKSHFGLSHLNHLDHGGYAPMSPVVIGRGYTRKFVDGQICPRTQLERIRDAYETVADASDVVLCEGTGHVAVGSVVGASNARVAKELGADMVLVANGGLGSTFDELELNRVLCDSQGVNVAGVIINKVRPDKFDQTCDYLGRAIMSRWGIPLLGCIPDRPFLGCPALADLERLFGTELINGKRHRFRHYRVPDINLVSTSLGEFLTSVRTMPTRTLYVTHVTRDDIVLGFLGEYSRLKRRDKSFESALLLCGQDPVSDSIMDILRDPMHADVPILMAGKSTRDAMDGMRSLTPKLNIGDRHRVEIAVEHYEPRIDFDLLLERTSSTTLSSSSSSSMGPVVVTAAGAEESKAGLMGLGGMTVEAAAVLPPAEAVLS